MKEGNWKIKTFRIRPEALELYKYLEYWGTKKGISSDVLFDEIVSFSLSYFKENPFNVSMVRSEINRVVKGFSLQKATLDELNVFQGERDELLVGETIEAILGLYAFKKLDPEEQKSNKLDSWFKLD